MRGFIIISLLVLVWFKGSSQSYSEVMNPENTESTFRTLIDASRADGVRKKTYFTLIRLGYYYSTRGSIMKCDSVLSVIDHEFKDLISQNVRWHSLDVADYYYLLSSFYYLKNDILRSKILLRKAVQLDPSNVFASDYLFRMFVNEGKLDSAEIYVQGKFRQLSKRLDAGDTKLIHFETAFKNMCQLKVLQRNADDLHYYLTKWLSMKNEKSGNPDLMKEDRFKTLSSNQLLYLSKYYGFRGEYERAIKVLRYAAELSYQDPDFEMDLLRRRSLGEMYYASGKIDTALLTMTDILTRHEENVRSLFPTFTESERETYVTSLNQDFDVFLSMVADHPAEAKDLKIALFNFQLFRKGLLLNTARQMSKVTMRLDNPHAKRLIHDIAQIKDSISLITLHSGRKEEDYRLYLQYLNEKREKLEREVNRLAYLEGGALIEDIEVSAVSKQLSSESCLVEQIRFTKWQKASDGLLSQAAPTYLSLILFPNDSIEMTITANAASLEQRYIRLYKNTMETRIEESLLYDIFWKPFTPFFKHAKTVYFSADGVYNLLNVNTLRNSETNTYVIDETQVINITSGKDLVTTDRARQVKNDALLIGFPSFNFDSNTIKSKEAVTRGNFLEEMGDLQDITFSPLPATKTEIEKIDHILKNAGGQTVVFTGVEATESNLRANKVPSILHLATHGFFLNSQDPLVNPLLKSGLILAGANNRAKLRDDDDGILTAFEISALDLRDTELVVLSACETGRGEIRNGDGVYGLQRAFKAAESRYIVTSLWKVDDEATMKLMELFYQSIETTHDIVGSFSIAQKELRKQYPSPYYWGAFKLIGN